MDITTNTETISAEPASIGTFFSAPLFLCGISIALHAAHNQQVITLVDLEAPLLGKSAQLLSPKEQEYYKRFKYQKRRKEWLGGRIAAKAALMQAGFADQAKQLTILPDEFGRPRATGMQVEQAKVSFSISHSSRYAVALAMPGQSCGIDLQKISPKLADLTNHFATAQELSLLARQPDISSEDLGLTMLWAAKESLKKSLLYDQSMIFSGTETREIQLLQEHVWQFECTVEGHGVQRATLYDLAPYILALCQADARTP
ncbi:MAG: 4'-phosphopantetheinyl transferase superfamily protein [Candidatus Electrothrix sp. AR3]|nr:4'-phosphopantetheinyl transferase superfamily protein [Candidatus Electrothrix sp. AR3]